MSTCPHLANWNPLAPDEVENPYPSFAIARRESPVFYSEALGAWIVTRYDDIIELLKDTARFSSRDSIYVGAVPAEVAERLPHGYPWDYPSLINLDPPDHARVRKLANQAFKPSVIAAKEPVLREIADALIDKFAADGQVDLMEHFAVPFPGEVMCRLLGVPPGNAAAVIGWTDNFLVMLDPHLPHERRLAAARGAADFYDFCDAFIAVRHSDPRDDVMSALIQAREVEVDGEPALTLQELVSVFSHLLIGGIETMRRLIGNMMLRIIEHPDQMAQVRADPALLDPAVEESLRHSSPTKGLFRRTTEDVELGGATIPKDALVVVMWASANHDEAHFERPEVFDIHRPDVSRHLTFSRGEHVCIGTPLARLELRVVLERLLTRLPNLRRAYDGPLAWAPLPLHHGLITLDLAWDPQAEQR